jgi:hypothetical protein
MTASIGLDFLRTCGVLAALFCGGCGSGATLVPVTGRVLVEGKPAAGAYVRFHPEGGERGLPLPSARVKEDGSFQLATLLPGENSPRPGAPPGRYAVTVMLRSPSPRGDNDERDLLPPRYLDPTASGLTAVVAETATEVPPFNLARR